MSKLKEFKKLKTIEEYFYFFDIEYDRELISVKRFHILKKFGEMIEKAKKETFENEQKELDFYKFTFLKIYKNFENGYSPSAAEIWDTFSRPSPCRFCLGANRCSSVKE